MKNMIVYVYILIFAFALSAGVEAKDSLFSSEAELQAVGMEIREAILNGDINLIKRYVASDGIPCEDSIIHYSKVMEDLRDKKSWLYSYLFSSIEFKKKYKNILRPMGLDRYFKEAKDIKIKVSFMKLKSNITLCDYGCIHYESSNLKYSPELCFYKKNGKWSFTDSPYPCT